VELRRCERGVMRITEAAPLAACVTSVNSPDEPTRAKLVEYLRAMISAQHTVLVHTQSGIFVARKRSPALHQGKLALSLDSNCSTSPPLVMRTTGSSSAGN
jgi:hypothetical protein